MGNSRPDPDPRALYLLIQSLPLARLPILFIDILLLLLLLLLRR